MTDANLQILVVILTERTDSRTAGKLTRLLSEGTPKMIERMNGVLAFSIIPVEDMLRAMASETNEPILRLLQNAEQRYLLAADNTADALLDELEPELQRRGLMDGSITFYQKAEAIEAYCRRRKVAPNPTQQIEIYATEVARKIGEYMMTQLRI